MTDFQTRVPPAPPNDPPAGYRWEIVPEGRDWTTAQELVGNRRCRSGSPYRGYCRRAAVAAMDRARPSSLRRLWYGYCGDHLYGRWIEDGRVVGWRLRQIREAR